LIGTTFGRPGLGPASLLLAVFLRRVFRRLSFDHDRVAVEVVQNDPVFEWQLRVDVARDARSRVRAIVVVDDHAAGDQPFPDPFCDIFGRLINVDVDMAEPEPEIFDLGASLFGEDAGKNLDIVEFQRFVEEFLD
jgi:hypothetical protein